MRFAQHFEVAYNYRFREHGGLVMNSFGAKSNLRVGDREFDYFSLEKAEQAGAGPVSKLPFSLKVMLENLLRHEDGVTVNPSDIRALSQSTTSGRLSPIKRSPFDPRAC
jgi:aconitase A